MQVKTKAIVLSAIRYQEKSLIVKCYTQSHGVVSYFVPSAFSTRKNSQRIAYFQPLTILEIEANHKNKGGLEYFKEIKTAVPYASIPFDVVKSAIVIFLAEILSQILQEEPADLDLYVFLETSLVWLDHHNEVGNFHLFFLVRLTQYLGFFPDLSNAHLSYFDLLGGKFREEPGHHTLNLEESIVLKELFDVQLFQSDIKFVKAKKQRLLEILIAYYQLHSGNFRQPRSLEVLKELFQS